MGARDRFIEALKEALDADDAVLESAKRIAKNVTDASNIRQSMERYVFGVAIPEPRTIRRLCRIYPSLPVPITASCVAERLSKTGCSAHTLAKFARVEPHRVEKFLRGGVGFGTQIRWQIEDALDAIERGDDPPVGKDWDIVETRPSRLDSLKPGQILNLRDGGRMRARVIRVLNPIDVLVELWVKARPERKRRVVFSIHPIPKGFAGVWEISR